MAGQGGDEFFYFFSDGHRKKYIMAGWAGKSIYEEFIDIKSDIKEKHGKMTAFVTGLS